MQLNLNRLSTHLQNDALKLVYHVSGDEPLQMLETIDAIRNVAYKRGFNDRTVFEVKSDFDWFEVLRAGASLSLFSNKHLIELRLHDHGLGKDGSKVLLEYTKNPPEHCILLISSAKIDKRSKQSKWHQAIDKLGVIVQVWPVPRERLVGWIVARCRQYNCRILPDAAHFLADRTEGNLFAASQELQKIFLLTDIQVIDLDIITHAMIDSSRYDPFLMMEAALAGDSQRTVRICSGLQLEGVQVMAVLGAVLWEFRRVCSLAYQFHHGQPFAKAYASVYPYLQKASKKSAILAAVERYQCRSLYDLFQFALSIDKMIRGLTMGRPWEQLMIFLLALAGSESFMKMVITSDN